MRSIIMYLFLVLLPFNVYSSVIDDEIKEALGPSKCTFHVTSGYRTVEDNRRVYGASNSYHLKDRARDIVFETEKCKRDAIKRFYLYDLTVIVYRVHLHVDNRTFQKCLVHYKFRQYRNCTKKERL